MNLIRAVIKDRQLVLLHPIPEEWAEGTELRILHPGPEWDDMIDNAEDTPEANARRDAAFVEFTSMPHDPVQSEKAALEMEAFLRMSKEEGKRDAERESKKIEALFR